MSPEELDAVLADLRTRVAALEGGLEETFSAIERSLVGLSERCAALEERLSDLEVSPRVAEPTGDDSDRELERLRSLERGVPGITDLLGVPMRFLDGPEVGVLYESIFRRRHYAFEHEGDTPVIVDGGANIGMATLFWKMEHPGARIVAFEPDAEAREVLEWNLQAAGHTDVTVVPAALTGDAGDVAFVRSADDPGRVGGRAVTSTSVHDDSRSTTTIVPSVSLREYLGGHVDLLKIDIEGAESEVLHECRDLLGNVARLVVEYHGFTGSPQALPDLLEVLRAAGFRLYIEQEYPSAHAPLINPPEHRDMDLQLVVWCHRRHGAA